MLGLGLGLELEPKKAMKLGLETRSRSKKVKGKMWFLELNLLQQRYRLDLVEERLVLDQELIEDVWDKGADQWVQGSDQEGDET